MNQQDTEKYVGIKITGMDKNTKQVTELTGAELDYWAGRAAGFSEREICIELRPLDARPHAVLYADGATKYGRPFCGNKGHGAVGWQPSKDWAQAGPIIERANIQLTPPTSRVHRNGGPQSGWGQSGVWSAVIWERGADGHRPWSYHETSPLIAAMRCYVASKFGKEVGD